MTPADRLRAAIHMESAAIAPQTSPLIEAAKEVLAENDRLVADEATYRAWTNEIKANIAWLRAENERMRAALDRIVRMDGYNDLPDAMYVAEMALAVHQQQTTIPEDRK